MKQFTILLLCSVLSVQCSLAQGVEDSVFTLNVIEVSAKRIFQKDEAGMKTTSVDSIILMDKINLSLSDILAENTPVFIKDHGRGAMATASFRGASASHTRLNWNGISITSPMTGMVDFSLVPVYIIDDMNLKHGSASLKDGPGGIGGLVNINNKVDWDNRLGIKVMSGVGSYRTFNEFLGISVGGKKWQSGTRFYYDYSKNDYSFINRGIASIDPSTGDIINPVEKNDNADYTRYGLLQELYYRVNNRNILSARWWWQQAERTIPRASSYEGPDNTNLNRQQDVDNRIVLDWKNYGKAYKLLLRSGYTAKVLDYSLKNNIPGPGEVSVIYSESRQNSLMNRASLNYDLNHGFSLETAVDLDYHHVETEDTVSKTGYTKDRKVMSFFLALRKDFADRLNLNLMIRQDLIDFSIVPVTPYFGFDLRLIRDRDLIFKGNIARNYHYPTLNDLFWQPGGNPDLQPEQGYSIELGLKYTLNLEKRSFSTELTAFRSDIDDWILWIPSYRGYWEPRNIDRVLSRGIEFNIGLQGVLGKWGYRVAGTYAYTSSVNYGDPITWGDESYGKQLVYIPLHSGNLMVHISFMGFYVTYQHNSYSERYTTSSNDISRRDWLYPYYMNDLIIGKEFRVRKVEINAEFKIYNLFDETYHSVLYRPMPGRNYMVMLMIKYQK